MHIIIFLFVYRTFHTFTNYNLYLTFVTSLMAKQFFTLFAIQPSHVVTTLLAPCSCPLFLYLQHRETLLTVATCATSIDIGCACK